MEKKDSSVLAAFSITIILLIAVIAIFFLIKNKSPKDGSLLEIEENKFEETNFNLTYITPKKVFKSIRNEEYLMIDTRNKQEFSENHIEASINIPLEEIPSKEYQLNQEQTIIFIEKQETQAGKKIANELKEKGYKLNYLEGGLYYYLSAGFDLVSYGNTTSTRDRAKVNLFDLPTLGEKLQTGERFIYLDVRSKTDFNKDHFENSINIPLENLEKNKKDVPSGKLLIIDEDPIRSFQAAVRLTDMNILTVYYLTNSYSEFKDAVKNKTLLK